MNNLYNNHNNVNIGNLQTLIYDINIWGAWEDQYYIREVGVGRDNVKPLSAVVESQKVTPRTENQKQ